LETESGGRENQAYQNHAERLKILNDVLLELKQRCQANYTRECVLGWDFLACQKDNLMGTMKAEYVSNAQLMNSVPARREARQESKERGLLRIE
jgi:hypothetical protein